MFDDGLTDPLLRCQLCHIDQILNEKVLYVQTGFLSTSRVSLVTSFTSFTYLGFHQTSKNCHEVRP